MSQEPQQTTKKTGDDGAHGNYRVDHNNNEPVSGDDTGALPVESAAAETAAAETAPTTTNNNDTKLINACSIKDGAMILFATDEWFAAADRLLLDTPPTFDPTLYCSQGKVMDGWETQRKRQMGHDYCIIQLSQRITAITSIEIDTAYFTGNQTPYISLWTTDLGSRSSSSSSTGSAHDGEHPNVLKFINAIPNITQRLFVQMKRQRQWQPQHSSDIDHEMSMDVDDYQGTSATPVEIQAMEEACRNYGGDWHTVLDMVPLHPGYETSRYHRYDVVTTTPSPATHVRLNYYPDGGVARLRIYGIPDATPRSSNTNSTCMIPKSPLYMPITTCDICTVIPHSENNDDTTIDATEMALNMHRSHKNNMDADTNNTIVEVSSCLQGGKGIYCSNQHYGTPDQLLLPTSGVDMGDGWETARQAYRPKILQPLPVSSSSSTLETSQGGGTLVDFGNLMEFCILELGHPISYIDRILIDTKHFKGNYPESVELSGCSITQIKSDNTDRTLTSATTVDWANDTWTVGGDSTATQSIQWYPILKRCRLSPHAIHIYDREQILFNVHHQDRVIPDATQRPSVSHVRVRIFPDGGVSRVRIYAKKSDSSAAEP